MKAKGPSAVTVSGGQYLLKDGRETPDTAEAVFDFPGFTALCSCRHATAFPMGGRRLDHGIQFLGTQATLLVDRKGYQIVPEGEQPEPVVSSSDLDAGEGAHHRDFIDCVRSRNRPVCDLAAGHRSATAMHLANISYRTGRKILWDPDREAIKDAPAASRLLSTKYRAPWFLG
jgi:hypothetical protein